MTEKKIVNKRKTKGNIEVTEYEEVKPDGTKSRSANVSVLGVVGQPKTGMKSK